MNQIRMLPRDQMKVVPQDWGELRWFAGKMLGNSEDMTLGACVLNPGESNPLHSHPNCSEVLHVLQGRIRHTFNDENTVEMQAGDTITIPPGIPHQATNIGGEVAILQICFSSADRQTKGECGRAKEPSCGHG